MRSRVTRALNRRLDAVFIEMEAAWDAYKDAKENLELRRRYCRSLRRADRLHQLLKTIP